MGLPVGMAIGAPGGSFGGVSSAFPGSTYQGTISTREQSSYNVQPEVTIAVRVSNAITESARRKDLLLSVTRNINDIDHRRMRGRTPPGIILTTLSELNSELLDYANDPEKYSTTTTLQKTVNQCAGDPYKVAKSFPPLGVYHNRSPHNSSEPISAISNSNVSDILSVAISNHCHMRDIFGCQLHPGDKIGLVYMKYLTENGSAVEIVPHAGEWSPELYEDSDDKLQWRVGNEHIESLLKQEKYRTIDEDDVRGNDAKSQDFQHVYLPLGRIWAPTMHAAFNQNQRENVVGPNSMYAMDDWSYQSDSVKSAGTASKYKSLEVELSPFKRPFM